ncbi:MAG: UDP-N-acetylmuramoyl-tripeptide--D-alanyl-D-alanine ligase [Akkermansiaceae bacterium]|nr:UDP-N-acetylmuramoyl-tripeptide--D-alanyl-D-alanine ligase [Akkermansiaceae bacterium]
MQLSPQTVARFCAGELALALGQHADALAAIVSVSTDTRTITAGACFVALKGEHFDGHHYLQQARDKGAVAAIVHRTQAIEGLLQIVVPDTQAALGRWAKQWLRQLPAKRIALTGSNGKTTVKNLSAAILQRVGPTSATLGNLNNEIGLPLTGLGVQASDRFAVLELGAGAPGDIAYLADIAGPHIALVNNAGPAHLERLGSVEGVAVEKSMIYRALASDGIAVIPNDDAMREVFVAAATHCHRIHFGLSSGDIRAEGLSYDHGSQFNLVGPFGRARVNLPLLGEHNVRNALAAAALSYAAGASLDAIVTGLARVQIERGRLQRVLQPAGWYLIDDSYNANPASVMAAIDTLAQAGGRSILVLGDMAELGPEAAVLHAEVGQHAALRGLSQLYSLGPKSALAAQASGVGRNFDTLPALLEALAPELQPGVSVLVKGSRSSKMERVVAALAARASDPHAPGAAGVSPC